MPSVAHSAASSVFAHGAGAQPLPAQQTALTGLTSVRVELLLIGEDLSIGLVERDLTEAVEDRLRRAGLAVRASDDNGVRGDQNFFRNQMGVTQALGTTSHANPISFIPDALLGYVDRFLENYGSIGAPQTLRIETCQQRVAAGPSDVFILVWAPGATPDGSDDLILNEDRETAGENHEPTLMTHVDTES